MRVRTLTKKPMLFRTLFACFLALTLLLGSCSRDPETRKKKFLANGNKYFESGKFREASIMFRNALKEDARYGEAYYRLALTSLRLGQYPDAVNAFKRSVELQPDNLDAARQLSDIYLSAYSSDPKKKQGFLKEAEDIAGRLKKTHANSFEYLRLQAMIDQVSQKPQEALDHYLAADKAKPGDPEIQVSIASMYIMLKREAEGEALLVKLLETSKGYLRGYDLLYGYYVRAGRIPDAERIVKLRVSDHPELVTARLALAAHQAALGRQDEMTKVLDEIIKDTAKFPDAYEQVGGFYLKLRDYDRSIKTWELGLAQAKNEATKKTLRKGIVEALTAQNKITEAQNMVEAMLKVDPKDPEVIAIRAHLWLLGGKPENLNAALADLQSVVSKLPENFVLRFDLGNALMIRGDLDAAKVQLLEVLKLKPDFFPARNALAQLSIQKQDWTSALQLSGEVLSVAPGNLFGRLIRSHALMAQNNRPEAKALLLDTMKLYPKSKDAQYQLGFAYFSEKDYKNAEENFRGVYFGDSPDLRGLMGLIETYMAQQRFDAAAKLVDIEIAKFPKALAFQVARGTIAIRAGDYDTAIDILRKVAQTQSDQPDLYMRIAEAQKLKGDLQGALDSWKKASDLAPTLTAPLLNRAMTLDGMKRLTEARPLYDQVLRIQPDNALALNNLAYLLAEEGNELDAALTLAQRARQKQPNDPMIADTLGWIYIKKGLANNAIAIFSDLTVKHPSMSLFHFHYAMALSQRGDKAQAKRSLELALKTNPPKQELEDIKKLQQKLG